MEHTNFPIKIDSSLYFKLQWSFEVLYHVLQWKTQCVLSHNVFMWCICFSQCIPVDLHKGHIVFSVRYKIMFYHHHHIYVMELGHLLTRSGLTYPEVSSKVYHDSFCQLGSNVSSPWVMYFDAFYLHVVSSFSCIPVICIKLVLFLTPLQFVHLFCNLSNCIVLFFSCISSVLLLFFWRHLL